MKKYLIVLMILIILMGVFNMNILGRSMTDIQRRMVGQTEYRINVVKGVVESENINKTYNCYIAGESAIYPNIPTFSRNPKLEIGDKVTIEFINGCRETPCILAPEDIRERLDTRPLIGDAKIFIYIWDVTDDYCIKSYDINGNFVKNVLVDVADFMIDRPDVMCVDNDDNIFYIPLVAGFHLIRKVDKDGTLLLEKDLGAGVGAIYALCASNDGYIYGIEVNTGFPNFNYHITKRSKIDLSLIDSVDLGTTTDYEGLVIDSSDYLYSTFTGDWSIRKWNMAAQQATRVVTYSRGLSHAGNLVGGIHTEGGNRSAFTIPDALNVDKTIWDLDGIAIPIATSNIGDNFIYSGSKKLARYLNDRTKVWETLISDDNTVYQISAYPF